MPVSQRVVGVLEDALQQSAHEEDRPVRLLVHVGQHKPQHALQTLGQVVVRGHIGRGEEL